MSNCPFYLGCKGLHNFLVFNRAPHLSLNPIKPPDTTPSPHTSGLDVRSQGIPAHHTTYIYLSRAPRVRGCLSNRRGAHTPGGSKDAQKMRFQCVTPTPAKKFRHGPPFGSPVEVRGFQSVTLACRRRHRGAVRHGRLFRHPSSPALLASPSRQPSVASPSRQPSPPAFRPVFASPPLACPPRQPFLPALFASHQHSSPALLASLPSPALLVSPRRQPSVASLPRQPSITSLPSPAFHHRPSPWGQPSVTILPSPAFLAV